MSSVHELKYPRVLLKLSGEMLAGSQGFGIDPPSIERLTEEVKAVSKLGVALGMVIGGGNIVRGATASAQGMDRVSADYMGMLATIINALAIQDMLQKKDVDTRVMTAIRMDELAEPYIRLRALRHMEKGRVVVFAGGTGNPYFSTDTAAALRAIEMEADVVIKATKVSGVFTADPMKDPLDAPAVSLCKDNGLPIIVLDLEETGSISAAIRGERVGTLVS